VLASVCVGLSVHVRVGVHVCLCVRVCVHLQMICVTDSKYIFFSCKYGFECV